MQRYCLLISFDVSNVHQFFFYIKSPLNSVVLVNLFKGIIVIYHLIVLKKNKKCIFALL